MRPLAHPLLSLIVAIAGTFVLAACSDGESLLTDEPAATTAAPSSTDAPDPSSPTTSLAPGTDGDTAEPDANVTTTKGPDVRIEPGDVVVTQPGGRWGDHPLTIAGTDEVSDDWTTELALTDWSDCSELINVLDILPDHARTQDNDGGADHSLDQLAVDAGELAETIATSLARLPSACAGDDSAAAELGIRIDVLPLEVNAVTVAFTSEIAERTSWMAVLYRNNIVSLLLVSEYGDTPLTDEHRDDFVRLVGLAFDELAQG